MMRSSLTAGSAYVFMGIDGGGNYEWQQRTSTGGGTGITTSGSGTAPNIWVKIVRSSDTLSGFTCTDGTSWSQVGTQSVTLGSSTYIGSASASGTTTTLNTSTFDNVSAP